MPNQPKSRSPITLTPQAFARFKAAAQERFQSLLIDDARKGLDDVLAGEVKDARSTIAGLRTRNTGRQATAPAQFHRQHANPANFIPPQPQKVPTP